MSSDAKNDCVAGQVFDARALGRAAKRSPNLRRRVSSGRGFFRDRGCPAAMMVALFVSTVGAPGARAADVPAWGAVIAFESDNLYHGLSESRGEPTPVVDVYLEPLDEDYIGASVSRVNLPGIGPSVETSVYAGDSGVIGVNWRLSGSVSRYFYSSRTPDLTYDFTELTATLDWRGLVSLGAFGSADDSTYSRRGALRSGMSLGGEVAAHYEIVPKLTIAAGAGYRHLGTPIDRGYFYADVGVIWELSRWQIDLEAIGVDSDAKSLFGRDRAGNRGVLTLIRRFGPWH